MSDHRSEGVHEGEEEREASEWVWGCSTTSLPMEFNDGLHELRRGISLQWRRLRFVFQRDKGEGSRGLIGKGFKGAEALLEGVIAGGYQFQRERNQWRRIYR
jgi:hypothetical protein